MKIAKNNLKVALILGKFAPLHRGHQLLIERALEFADRVIVMIYDRSDVTPIPVKTRANWIRSLYQQVCVVEAPAGPPDSKGNAIIMQQHVDFILRYLPEPVTHIFSSEWYGDYISQALGAKNVVVDLGRQAFPISGTLARGNPRKYKEFLNPLVYKDMLKVWPKTPNKRKK